MAKILLNVEVNKADLKQVEQQLDKALNPKRSTGGGAKTATVNVDNLRKSYANLLTTIQSTEKYFKKGTFDKVAESAKKYQSELMGLNGTVELTKEEAQKFTGQLNEVQREFAETKASAKNFHGSLGEIVKGFIKFQAAAMIVMKPLQMIRNAWADLNETLVETEDAVVALRRVAGQEANANELYDLAQRYGQTFENVSEIATNFARAGYEWNETIKATEAALLALNTAELDASSASDGMIAILQQFGHEASQLESVIDKLNITADNAAVSTDKLLNALVRTGSSAKNAKLSLEETVGIITALSEATGRSGENLGTAVNSLIQFSTKASSLETFEKLGGDVANVVEKYKQGGATVLEIWQELSTIIKKNAEYSEGILGKDFSTSDFDALNEELKQSLGETFAETTEIYDTASTFRKNYFIALLQNLDQVQESLDTMQKSQGYSQKENLQYLDTYTARVNSLEAKWQEIANDEQGLLAIKKFLVDFASTLLEIIDYMGGVKTILLVTGSILIATIGPKVIANIVNGFKSMTAALVNFNTVASSTQAVMGWIGLAASAVSIISGLTSGIEKKNAEAAKERREAAKSAWLEIEEEAKSLALLTNEYESLEQVENKTIEQENNYKNIQESIVEILGYRAVALEKLDEETKEYTDTLNKLTQSERKRQAQTAQASANALKEEAFSEKWRYGQTVYGNFIEGSLGTYSEVQQALQGEIDRLYYNGQAGSSRYTNFVNALESLTKKTEQYIETQATATTLQALMSGDVKNKETFDTLVKNILKETNAGEEYKEFIEGIVSSVSGYKIEAENATQTISSKTNLSDVVNKLEEIRENTEKTKELEEKQLALQEARNQRTVRVFNAETGQWEMQANEKDISKAEKDLKDVAMDNIIDYLSTNEAQQKLNAGEFTLPDWLAEMIAQPTTDDKFNAFMTAMGIMSGAANKTPFSSGAVYNNSSNSTTNNNQSYSLNGIPIPVNEAGKYFTQEALELLNQMGD